MGFKEKVPSGLWSNSPYSDLLRFKAHECYELLGFIERFFVDQNDFVNVALRSNWAPEPYEAALLHKYWIGIIYHALSTF